MNNVPASVGCNWWNWIPIAILILRISILILITLTGVEFGIRFGRIGTGNCVVSRVTPHSVRCSF